MELPLCTVSIYSAAGSEPHTTPPPLPAAAPPEDIFSLYEENIGLITPLIADELRKVAPDLAAHLSAAK